MLEAGFEPPAFLLGPEHGFFSVEQDMIGSADGTCPWTGLEIRSLYGEAESSLRPEPGLFTGVDVLIIDLQDVGARYYTYGATAVWAADAARRAGLEIWILDRPNPLGGTVVEGPLRRDGFESFVGAFAVPVRHGLTLGELVLLEARRRGWEAGDQLRIWTVEEWSRGQLWSELGRPWIAPSPNLPTFEAAVVYPGACLIEATELSEGRGTTRPFQLIGAPHLEPRVLAERLARAGLRGVTFVPTYFRPQFQKHAGAVCGGVQLLVTEPALVDSLRLGVELLRAVHDLDPEAFAWRSAPYEFVSDRPAIDLLTGDDRLRRALAAGEVDDWIASWGDDERAFLEERRSTLLYAEVVADR